MPTKLRGESVTRVAAKGDPMTPRELEMRAHLLTPMQDNQDIADVMRLSECTVKVYASRLFTKLGVANRHVLMGQEIERLQALVDQQNSIERKE